MKRKENLRKSYSRVYEKCLLKAQKILPNKIKISQKIKKARKILSKLENIPRFKSLSKDIGDFCDLLTDYLDGRYTKFPIATIVYFLGGLLYFVLPFDAMPDILPFFGWLDDAGVIAFILKKEHDEIQNYLKWKKNNSVNKV